MCGMYKSDNRLLRYQTISNFKFYWLLSQEQLNRFQQSKLCFFFLNQQFITQYVKADRGSYFIATYRESILTRGEKQKEKRGRRK